jgi:transposase
MTNYREILRLKSLGLNHSQIVESMAISRPTVITVLQRAALQGLDWQAAESLSDKELTSRLFPREGGKLIYRMPDYDYVHRELAKPGVTQQLLWFEYCDQCRASGEIPYQQTQFRDYYHEYLAKTKATMHINRKPGEIMEVDWAGQTAGIIDTDTGEIIPAYIFVSALPHSGYAYAEAFLGQNQEDWITAHVNAYNFYGGVTRILVPDNLKTGVIKHAKTEIVLNRSYQEMAEHYGTAVIPARVRTPRDKSSVEAAVGVVSTFILAAIRNQKFFTLRELNAAIRERLHALNHKPFQKKDGSRALLFAEERDCLLPLPKSPFEMAVWKTATVSFNYHVEVDGRFYSVPFEYIKRRVDVRITRRVVEVLFAGNRICSHTRITDPKVRYSTEESHMPPNHQQYIQWNGDRFRKWAAKIGPNTATAVEAILTGHKVEQQAYRACMALLKLSDVYTPERLEAACAKALFYTPRPSYKAVQSILKSGQDKVVEKDAPPQEPSEFGFTRGSDYYALSKAQKDALAGQAAELGRGRE